MNEQLIANDAVPGVFSFPQAEMFKTLVDFFHAWCY